MNTNVNIYSRPGSDSMKIRSEPKTPVHIIQDTLSRGLLLRVILIMTIVMTIYSNRE